MKLRDLGRIEGPIAAFGGPLSNLHAAEALRAAVGGMPVLCTGDVAGYCAHPSETVALMREWGVPLLAGNCERGLAEGADACGCGFADGTACDAMSGAWWAHASGALDAEARAWMAGLPDALVFDHDGIRTAAIHGGATEIARFLWPSSPEAAFAEEVEVIRAACGPVARIIAGHCGLAFARGVAGVLWINAGTPGMPPHDERPETRWARIDADGPVFERLSYDHDAAAQAMEAAGLTQGYHETLRSGVWPSEDVLPAELRR